MLQKITQILSASIEGILQKEIPLATQRTTSEGKSFPAIYAGKGQYKEISIDNYAGLCYFRSNGKVDIDSYEQPNRPMQDLSRYSYPVRLVACVQNDVLGKDDAFSPDYLAMSFIKNLQQSNGNLKTELSANSAIIKATSYDTDVKDILSEEYEGIERLKNSIPYQYTLIAVDLDIEVIISASCINLLCNTYCS